MVRGEVWQNRRMVEPWTRERRLERTRSLLLDAAEHVFAEKGFIPATLDDIAKAAGYSKGAIYKYFTTKEELFLAASDRYWRRYFDNFTEVMSSSDHIGARELEDIGERWRKLSRERGAAHAALGLEFHLYLLRNPEARERVAAKRSEIVDQLAKYIVAGVDNIGATLLIPAATFAHLIIATTDAIELGSHLENVDLYQPMVEMYVSAVKMP
jgi:AcrR family transcriptional regulator